MKSQEFAALAEEIVLAAQKIHYQVKRVRWIDAAALDNLDVTISHLQETIIEILENCDHDEESQKFRKTENKENKAKPEISDAEIERSQNLIAEVLGPEEVAKLDDLAKS